MLEYRRTYPFTITDVGIGPSVVLESYCSILPVVFLPFEADEQSGHA